MLHILMLSIVSLQINRMFTYQDVKHLLVPRMPPLKISKMEYGDIKGYKAMIVPTKIPKDVILCMKPECIDDLFNADTISDLEHSTRMHFFLHDKERVRACFWDKDVSYDEKKEIVLNMMEWLQKLGHKFDHLLYDYEDGSVFKEVSEEMESNALEKEMD